MSRITRKKAAEIAEALHVDEDAILDGADENAMIKAAKDVQLLPSDRAPLGQLEPNSADNHSQSDDTQEFRKSTRGRKAGKKGAKGRKKDPNLAASAAELSDTSLSHQEVLPDEHDSTPSPVSEKAAEDLMGDAPSVPEARIPVEDAARATGSSNAVKLTRSQFAKYGDLSPEQKSLMDGIGQLPEGRAEMTKEEYFPAAAVDVPEIINPDNATSETPPIDAPASPLPGAVPKVVAHLRTDTPAKRSTSNKENVEPVDVDSSSYDILEDAAVSAATPRPAAGPEDPIAALDNLDDAVENVNNDIPDVQTSPEKPKSKKEGAASKAMSKRAAPVVRATKASQARMSLAQNPEAASSKAPTLGRPRPSLALGRSTSGRQTSTSSKHPENSSAKRLPSGSKDHNVDGVEKKEVIIPHSKRRPVSMSFPTPPPPPKSTKAPTRSTFQLPGEAVAAKLKAAREARMQKENNEEEEKKPAFKARPVPPSLLSKAPSVRPTNASKARESIMTGRDARPNTVDRHAAAAHRRAQSVAVSNPKSRVISNGSTSASFKPGASTLGRSTGGATRHRPSTALANIGKPRTSVGSSVQPAPLAGKGTAKGKEVFNRAAAAKAAAEKEKADKEAAAKKARAEAAERGRLASREWAEKQKKAAAAKKATSTAKEGEARVAGEQVVCAVDGTEKPTFAADAASPASSAVIEAV